MPNMIYCYTGTGNSLAASQMIAAVLGDTRVLPMSKNTSIIAPAEADRVGFVFPVHHWTIPRRAREFISGLSIPPNAYIFAIAACGGIAINALNDFDALIAAKGATLSYAAVHRNVSSYIVAYERFPDPAVQIPRSRIALEAIADDIRNRARKRAPRGNPIKFLLRHGMAGAAKKFPELDRNFVVSNQCTGCATCERVCPADNIRLEQSKPVFLHQCEQCMACIQYCPREAINYGEKTKKRTRYHHPDVSAAELASFRKAGQ